MIAKKLTDLIGNTPLLEFSNFNASKGLKAKVIVSWNISTRQVA